MDDYHEDDAGHGGRGYRLRKHTKQRRDEPTLFHEIGKRNLLAGKLILPSLGYRVAPVSELLPSPPLEDELIPTQHTRLAPAPAPHAGNPNAHSGSSARLGEFFDLIKSEFDQVSQDGNIWKDQRDQYEAKRGLFSRHLSTVSLG